MQPIAPGTEIRCPLCGVLMSYRQRDHYWECPVTTCRLQVWPPVEEPEYKSAEEMFAENARKIGMVKRRGGAKTGRKHRKPNRQDATKDSTYLR